MELRLIADTQDHIQFHTTTDTFPAAAEQVLIASGDFGSIETRQLNAGAFTIYHTRYQMQRDCGFYCAVNEAAIELHFMLEQSIAYNLSGLGKVHTKPLDYNLTFLPHIENKSVLRAGKPCVSVDLHLPLHYLHQYLGHFSELPKFLDAVASTRAIQYQPRQQKANAEMLRIIASMLSNDYSGLIRSLYLESKCVELLILAMTDLSVSRKQIPKIRPDDLERMHEARRLQLENMENPYGLVELARKLGTNDHKLKVQFKQVFGETVFGYLMEAKMAKARDLLISTDLPITEIAFMTGYKNPSNFTEAFRRQFKCSPRHMRQHPGNAPLS